MFVQECVCVCVLWYFMCPLHLLSLDREKPSVFTNMHYKEMWHFVTFHRTSNMEVCGKIHCRHLAPRLLFHIKFTLEQHCPEKMQAYQVTHCARFTKSTNELNTVIHHFAVVSFSSVESNRARVNCSGAIVECSRVE